MQAGEDPGIGGAWMAGVIREIKERTGLAVTLSLGERSEADLRAWREAGADRYLLRFETTDPSLYRAIHPSLPGTLSDRIAQLLRMRDLGFEIGTGVMVGIPGQTWETLADDIWTFRDYDMDMIGIGPYIASPGTPLDGALGRELSARAGREQTPNDPATSLKVLALTRLVCPETNIPSTTALATVDPASGRANGLLRGANVIMPNLTPPKYRVLYQIYPGKAGLHETADITRARLDQILALGRTVGRGPGTSPRVARVMSAVSWRPALRRRTSLAPGSRPRSSPWGGPWAGDRAPAPGWRGAASGKNEAFPRTKRAILDSVPAPGPERRLL